MNYAAQVAKAFPEAAPLIASAQHFVLPESGRLFDDAFRGIRGQEIHLPYPRITLAYPVSYSEPPRPGKRRVSKRLVIANENEDGISICSFPFYDELGQWRLYPVRVIVPYDCWDTNGDIWFRTVALNEKISAKMEDPEFESSVIDDISQEIRAVLELVEGLSCRNVTTEVAQISNPAINARRIKAGKAPIYEVRRLVIVAGRGPRGGGCQSGTKSSPRQHLRRGHIRRLQSGNYWINSCAVGLPANGVIEKTYEVRPPVAAPKMLNINRG